MSARLAAALVTALWLFGATMGVGLASHVHAHPGHSEQCQEDDPCWDCHTMGNRICGPVDQPFDQA